MISSLYINQNSFNRHIFYCRALESHLFNIDMSRDVRVVEDLKKELEIGIRPIDDINKLYLLAYIRTPLRVDIIQACEQTVK